MGKIKVLNLYAGIGGNRKLWEEVDVTAVELDPQIAAIYQDFFPDDEVIVGDAHKYLLKHFKEFDFVWASPPCQTHTCFNNLNFNKEENKIKYPDMSLYQEIIILKHFHKGKWVVENVKTYYEPPIKPWIAGNHFFWSNFVINYKRPVDRGIRTKSLEEKQIERFDISHYKIGNRKKRDLLNNCVLPELGKYVFDCAFKVKQQKIFEKM